MIDPVSVAIVAVAALGGWLVGRHGRLRAQRPKPVKPICMCGHHYGTHHPETGACMNQHLTDRYDEKKGEWQEWSSCSCVRYTGPQPVEQYWVAPSADMSIITAPRQMEER